MSASDPGSDRELAEAAVSAARQEWSASKEIGALEALVDAYFALVAVIPKEQVEHGMAMIDLCSLSGVLWGSTRSDEVWDRAEGFVRSWTETIPRQDWRWELYVLAHGVLLAKRAEVTGDLADIAVAINALETSRAGVKGGSGIDGTASTQLAQLKFQRYGQEHDPMDLEAAIEDAARVLASDRAFNHEKVQAAKVFAVGIRVRDEQLDSFEGLQDLADVIKENSRLTEDPTDLGDLEGELGAVLRRLWMTTKEPRYLDEAIEAYQRGLDLATDPEIKATREDNLGNGLASRYDLSHNPADLDGAIDCSRRAIELLPADSPNAGRAYANLGVSLTLRSHDRRRPEDLDEAIEVFAKGLAIKDVAPDVRPRLSLGLGFALWTKEASGSAPNLDETIAVLESGLQLALLHEEELPTLYRLVRRGNANAIGRLLAGALLARSSQDESLPDHDVRRALVVGEAAKSVLLTHELLRRSLEPPAALSDWLVGRENDLLAHLATLEAHELSPNANTSVARRLRRMEMRKALREDLEDVWDEMLLESTAEHYVELRRDLPSALMEALSDVPGRLLLLSMIETDTVLPDGTRQRGLCLLGLWPDVREVRVLFHVSGNPVSEAVARLASEVIENRGRRKGSGEGWWRELGQLVGAQALQPDTIVALSPTEEGYHIPWQLLLDHAGWELEGSSSLPVIVVPTLSLVTLVPASLVDGWHVLVDPAKADVLPDEQEVYDSIIASSLMSGEPSTGPLIVGNPTSDLAAASKEAIEVAKILGVEPLVGGAATIDRVREGFATSSLVHLAAHAAFRAEDPLGSTIHLADGALTVRELIGSWCTASLAVLSACESGSGAVSVGGELLGLGAALLRAGVRSVIASLWQVDDAASRYLMTSLHEGLASGHPPAVALANATASTRVQPGWSDPYYWAAFVVIERGQQSANRGSTSAVGQGGG